MHAKLASNLIAQDAMQNKNALGYIPVAERCADSGLDDAVISRGFQETLTKSAIPSAPTEQHGG